MAANRYLLGVGAVVGMVLAGTVVAATASAQTRPTAPAGPVVQVAREPAPADFAAAACEFAVPEPLLLAYSCGQAVVLPHLVQPPLHVRTHHGRDVGLTAVPGVEIAPR